MRNKEKRLFLHFVPKSSENSDFEGATHFFVDTLPILSTTERRPSVPLYATIFSVGSLYSPIAERAAESRPEPDRPPDDIPLTHRGAGFWYTDICPRLEDWALDFYLHEIKFSFHEIKFSNQHIRPQNLTFSRFRGIIIT